MTRSLAPPPPPPPPRAPSSPLQGVVHVLVTVRFGV